MSETHTHELTVHGHDGAGNQFANVFHFLVTTEPPELNVATSNRLCKGFRTVCLPPYLACLPSDITVRALSARITSPAHGGTSVLSIDADNTGGRGTSSVSLNIGPQLAWYPGENVRTVGKTYLPGIAQADCHEGQMVLDLTAACEHFVTVMLITQDLDGPEGGTYSLAVFNKASLSYIACLVGYVRPRLGSQRRRTLPVF